MKKTIIAAVVLMCVAVAGRAQQTYETASNDKQSQFSLRANLLYVPFGTPFLGFEWKPTQKFGVVVDGAYSYWSWDDSNRHLGLRQVNPELRYYFNHCWYAGVSGEVGDFNIKLSDDGRQGHFWGGGFTGGYKARLSRSLDLDLHLSLGYAEYYYNTYQRQNNDNVVTDHTKRYWWGPYQGGVTLAWKICK